MQDVHNLINIGPTNLIQILNQHLKNLEVGTGAQQQRQEVY